MILSQELQALVSQARTPLEEAASEVYCDIPEVGVVRDVEAVVEAVVDVEVVGDVVGVVVAVFFGGMVNHGGVDKSTVCAILVK